MMEHPRSTTERKAAGRGRWLGIVVFVLAFALVGGGVIVVRQALRSGTTGDAGGTADGGGEAVSRPVTPVAKMLDDARAAMSEQRFGVAESILTRAAEAYPEDQSVRLALAQNLVTQKKFKEAYANYEAAIALGPKTAAGQAGVGDPKLHFEAGTVASEAGYVERAEEHYSMAQSGDPSEPRYPLYLAMTQIKLGKDNAALASLIRATKLNPELAIAWGTLGELALKENQLGLAMQHVEKARRLEPEGARWRVVEARILKRRAQEGDVERALQLLLSLDKADRSTPEVLRATGECYGLLQRPGDAAYMYAEAAKLRPDDADTAYQAALWYQRAGNEAEALRFGKIAQELLEKKGGNRVSGAGDRVPGEDRK